MAKLGDRVLYHVHEGHKTTTVKSDQATGDKVETVGSIHHHEITIFAGTVGRVHASGSADIMILVPNKEPKWCDAVHEGEPTKVLKPKVDGTAADALDEYEPLPDWFEVL